MLPRIADEWREVPTESLSVLCWGLRMRSKTRQAIADTLEIIAAEYRADHVLGLSVHHEVGKEFRVSLVLKADVDAEALGLPGVESIRETTIEEWERSEDTDVDGIPIRIDEGDRT